MGVVYFVARMFEKKRTVKTPCASIKTSGTRTFKNSITINFNSTVWATIIPEISWSVIFLIKGYRPISDCWLNGALYFMCLIHSKHKSLLKRPLLQLAYKSASLYLVSWICKPSYREHSCSVFSNHY